MCALSLQALECRKYGKRYRFRFNARVFPVRQDMAKAIKSKMPIEQLQMMLMLAHENPAVLQQIGSTPQPPRTFNQNPHIFFSIE